MNLKSAERVYELSPREDVASYVARLRRDLYQRGFVPGWRRQSGAEAHVIVLARFGNTYEVRIPYDMTSVAISSSYMSSPENEADDVALIRQHTEELLEGPKEEPALPVRKEVRIV